MLSSATTGVQRTSRHFQLPVARMRILFIDSVVYSNSKIWKTNNLNRFEFDFVKRFISNRFIISFYVRHPRIDIWIIHEHQGVLLLHANNQILHFCSYIRCDCLIRSARHREITFRMRVIVLLIRVSIPLPPTSMVQNKSLRRFSSVLFNVITHSFRSIHTTKKHIINDSFDCK